MGDATYWRALAKGYKARARIAEDELAECRRKLNSCNRHYDALEDEARWLEQARAEERERCCAVIQDEIDDCEQWIDTVRETEGYQAARVYALQRIGLVEAQAAIRNQEGDDD